MKKYKCPHCGSVNNCFFATDSDMGYGQVYDVYRCECGRFFDEPYSYNDVVGLPR